LQEYIAEKGGGGKGKLRIVIMVRKVNGMNAILTKEELN